MEASILYGKYDNLGNALIVRINNFSNSIYTVGGYLVGFTSNNIDYYHFLKADFKKDDKDETNSGYYSVKDWLSYWADEKKLEDIKKFENETSFDYAQNGDTIVVEKQKVKSSTLYYNIVEVYKYTWNSNDHLIPFTDKIYIPSSIVPIEKTYTADSNATSFFNNSKNLISLVSTTNKNKLAELLIYSAFCIHHINQSIFPLFTDPSHQTNILEQKNFWSNPFGNVSGLTEAEIMNLVENFYQEVVNFYALGFRSKRKIEIVKQDKKFFYLALFMGVKALTTLTAKLKLDILISAKDEMNIFFEEEAVENLVIRVTQSFDNNTTNRIDEFLEGLIINKVEKDKTKKTLYQYIYEKMSSSLLITKGVISLSNWVMSTEFKPTDTKGQFVQTIYLLWQLSKYCPYNEDGSIKPNVIGFDKVSTGAATFDNNISGIFKYTHTTAYKVELDVENSTNEITYYKYPRANNDAAPIVMPYSSEKYVNIFFENFKFEFQGEKILAKEAVTVFGVNATPNIGYNLTVNLTEGPSERAVLYGKYEIFQPITIINSDVDTVVPIYSTQGGTFDVTGEKLNSFVPLFVLLYVSETNQRNNSETLLGYAVDIPLTLSGIGNLPKIRHLRWAAAGADAIGLVTLQGLTIIIDGLTFTSQVLHYISLIMGDCAGQDGFCNDFKVFSDRLNIVCLCLNGGRMVGIGMTSLTRQASRLIDRVAAGSTSEAVIRANLRARLVLANASATAETIDKTVDNIYGLYVRSNNLYTNPLGVALSLTFGTYKFAKVIFDKIVNTLIKQQNKLYNIADNIDVGEIVNFPPRFSIYKFEPIVNGEIITWRKLSQTVHTEAEICEIVRRGKELKFHDDLITHFLLRSLRVQKNKTYLQVIGFMDKYNEFKTVRNSVPYSFTSAGHLESFDNYFRTLLQKYGLEKFLDEYQISGSSLYQELVPDLDLCSYIKKGKFYEAYAESAELYYKNIHNPAIPDRMHNTLYKYFKKYIEAKPVFLGANPQITPRQIVENLENLDQLSAKGIIRMENGKIISLADELYQMKNLPNNIKPTLNKPNPNGGYTWGGVDFNIFINANNGRRLSPDLTIKIN